MNLLFRGKRAVPILLAMLLLTTQSGAANPNHAADTASSGSQLSDFINIWDVDVKENLNIQVVYNPDYNEYLVVWLTKQDEYSTDIWARRIAADGTLFPEFNIVFYPGKQLNFADIIYNPDRDEYYAVFEYPYSSTDTDLYARSFRYDGSVISDWKLVDDNSGVQNHPSVAYNSLNHEYLVVYMSPWDDGVPSIQGWRINPVDLTRIGNLAGISPASATIDQVTPDVAYNPQRNNYLVCYQKEKSSLPALLYQACRTVSSDLTFVSLGTEHQISADFEHGPISTAVGDDEFLVSWGGSGSNYIKARRVRYDGVPLGPAGGFLISPSGPANFFRRDPQAGANFLGYWVVWETFDSSTIDEADVFGNFIPFGADQAAGEQFPVDTVKNYQAKPAIDCRWQGSCLVTDSFNLEDYPAGDKDIRGRFLSPWQLYLPVVQR